MNPSYEIKREALEHSLRQDASEFGSAVKEFKEVAHKQVASAQESWAAVRGQFESARGRMEGLRRNVGRQLARLDPRPQIAGSPWPWLGGAFLAGVAVVVAANYRAIAPRVAAGVRSIPVGKFTRKPPRPG